MPKNHAPLVLSEFWLDWYFDAGKEPFKETTNEAEVNEKKKKIENYAKSHLLKKQPSWSLTFEWSIADNIPLVYNLKATIVKKKAVAAKQNLKTAAVATRGIGTPQPPPQPPPPKI